MADDRKYYVLCGDNCKFEGMTKEQILAAIAEATGATVTEIDNAFISKIKEINKGATVQIWLGTTAEYNAIQEKRSDVFYIKTDDAALADLKKYIDNELLVIKAGLPLDFNYSVDLETGALSPTDGKTASDLYNALLENKDVNIVATIAGSIGNAANMHIKVNGHYALGFQLCGFEASLLTCYTWTLTASKIVFVGKTGNDFFEYSLNTETGALTPTDGKTINDLYKAVSEYRNINNYIIATIEGSAINANMRLTVNGLFFGGYQLSAFDASSLTYYVWTLTENKLIFIAKHELFSYMGIE